MREERAAGGQRLDHGSARGGPVAAWARGGHGDGRGVAPVLGCGAREKARFVITPPNLLNNLQKGPPAEFGNLKEVPEHF